MRKIFSLNSLIVFTVILSVISLSYQRPNLKKNNLQRKVDDNVELSIEVDINLSDLTDEIETTIPSPENSNSTNFNTFYPSISKKRKGLSAGAIIGIIIPCLVALGAVAAFAFLAKRASGPPNNFVPNHFESSMDRFRTNGGNEIKPAVKEVEVIHPNLSPQPNPIPTEIKEGQVETANQVIPTHQIIASQNPNMTDNNVIKPTTSTSQNVPENKI